MVALDVVPIMDAEMKSVEAKDIELVVLLSVAGPTGDASVTCNVNVATGIKGADIVFLITEIV